MLAAIYINEKIDKYDIVQCIKYNSLRCGVTVTGLLVDHSITFRANITGDFT
jgi:hypothetical protein